jgi:hypothetical protein
MTRGMNVAEGGSIADTRLASKADQWLCQYKRFFRKAFLENYSEMDELGSIVSLPLSGKPDCPLDNYATDIHQHGARLFK